MRLRLSLGIAGGMFLGAGLYVVYYVVTLWAGLTPDGEALLGPTVRETIYTEMVPLISVGLILVAISVFVRRPR